MGKPKARRRNQGETRAQTNARSPKASSPSLSSITTVEDILAKIEAYTESCDFALAEKFANRGIERFPDSSKMLEAAAQCFTEVGHISKARTCYLKAISSDPLRGWRNYLGLAQLLEGKEAVLQYTRGIEVMEKQLGEFETTRTPGRPASMPDDAPPAAAADASSANTKKPADLPEARDVSNAYLAISEIYTTDLCDDEGAEEHCKYAIEKAMFADPKNPEAFQQMANFHLIKGDKQLAKQCVKGGLSLWYAKHLPLEERPAGLADQNIGLEPEEDSHLPPLAFQIDTAKALIECEEYDLALKLFAEFIEQSPTDPELWYLSGFVHFLHGEDFFKQARSDFNKAKKFSVTPHGVCYDIIAQCDEHLATIAQKLPDAADSDDEDGNTAANPPPENSGARTAEDGDSDWETDDEEDVEMKE